MRSAVGLPDRIVDHETQSCSDTFAGLVQPLDRVVRRHVHGGACGERVTDHFLRMSPLVAVGPADAFSLAAGVENTSGTKHHGFLGAELRRPTTRLVILTRSARTGCWRILSGTQLHDEVPYDVVADLKARSGTWGKTPGRLPLAVGSTLRRDTR